MIENADALVTYHGTSALEYASLGKPVMVADRGWYHDFGQSSQNLKKITLFHLRKIGINL